ncbi:MAG: hypothetical protein ACXVCD_17390 [Pseudobdellovibrionaceae bacterium]
MRTIVGNLLDVMDKSLTWPWIDVKEFKVESSARLLEGKESATINKYDD